MVVQKASGMYEEVPVALHVMPNVSWCPAAQAKIPFRREDGVGL
jgi:hypothetical protein